VTTNEEMPQAKVKLADVAVSKRGQSCAVTGHDDEEPMGPVQGMGRDYRDEGRGRHLEALRRRVDRSRTPARIRTKPSSGISGRECDNRELRHQLPPLPPTRSVN